MHLRKFSFFIIYFLSFFSSGIAAASEQAPALYRGVNLSSWFANAPRQPLGVRDFRQIEKLGFDFVRLPVNPEFIGFKLDGGPQQLQHLDLRKLDAAIDGLTQANLAVILDIHPENGFMTRLEQGGDAETQFIALWKALAAHYGKYPNDHVVFELLNEPAYYRKTRRYNDFIARVVKGVRETEPDRLLIVNTPGVLSLKPVDALKATTLIPDPNIAYDVHYYQPYVISHQGMIFGFEGKQIRYLHNVPYPSSLVDKKKVIQGLAPGANPDKALREVNAYVDENWTADSISAYLAPAAQWAKVNKVRVLVLEFGVLRNHIDAASRMRWITDVRQVLDNLGLGWAYWDYTDQFGIMKLVGKTAIDPDGAVKFENPEDPANARVAEPDAVQALGLKQPQNATPEISSHPK